MSEHGDSEIKRLPLDSLVLELKGMLGNNPVVPVLEVTFPPLLFWFLLSFFPFFVGVKTKKEELCL